MGTYSNFTIRKKSNNIITKDEVDWLENKSNYTFSPQGTLLYLTFSKWYTYNEDMKEMSIIFPDELWIVDIEIEQVDYYREFFYQGKSIAYEGFIEYPEPDYSQLGYIEPASLGTVKTIKLKEDK